MFTVDTVMDALKKFDIDQATLDEWEQQLGLSIPVDEYGRKQYSPHHVNLFKNIKKHLALGRTMSEIRNIINLPPENTSKPAIARKPANTIATPAVMAPAATVTQEPLKRYATAPQPPVLSGRKHQRPIKPGGGGEQLIQLVDRLTAEKDQIQEKLIQTERLNSHLYNANKMFHRKVKELTEKTEILQNEIKGNPQLQFLDEKAKLQKQALEAEKLSTKKQRDLEETIGQLAQAKAQLEQKDQDIWNINQEVMQNRLKLEALETALKEKKAQLIDKEHQTAALKREIDTTQKDLLRTRMESQSQKRQFDLALKSIDPGIFCGEWEEAGELAEVVYDNFGINIEPARNRQFRIDSAPDRIYGRTAIIATQYEYETNTLWKRNETLTVYAMEDNLLEGEVAAEYIIDGIPVAKAIYRVTCHRD